MTDQCPPTPTSPSRQRSASVPLSPFWVDADAAKEDNEAVASPRARSRGQVEVSLENIATFPMPEIGDECSAELAFMHPDKRLSERNRRASQTAPKEVMRGVVVEGKAEVDAGKTPSVTSTSSDDSIHSEFSENTAGSKLLFGFGFELCLVSFKVKEYSS